MLKYDFHVQYKKGVNLPANFLSFPQIDEFAAIQKAKAIAAAIDPLIPTLAEQQVADPNIVKFKQFLSTWPLGTSK